MTHLHYRVWDGENMHYWDDEGISLTIEGSNWFLHHERIGYIASSEEVGAALMWGTGVKDKRKRPIYEGDGYTAKHKSGKVYTGQVKYDLSFVFDIEGFEELFINGVGAVKTNRTFDIHSFVKWFDEVEVIYENPELLGAAE